MNVASRTLLVLVCCCVSAESAELVTLTAETWEQYAPRGKEVDCIYGDFVLKNDRITVVVANPIPVRDANLTVKEVGGAVIDLTVNDVQSDQLSAFYPGAGRYSLKFDKANLDGEVVVKGNDQKGSMPVFLSGAAVELVCNSFASENLPTMVVSYRLMDRDEFLTVTSTFVNEKNEPIDIELADSVRADRTFETGNDTTTNLAWWFDKWFGQAYGIVAEAHAVELPAPEDRYTVNLPKRRKGLVVWYRTESTVRLAPGEKHTLVRRIFPGTNSIDVRAVANQLAQVTNRNVSIDVRDAAGPVGGADVVIHRDGEQYARGVTRKDGVLACNIPSGKCDVTITSISRGTATIAVGEANEYLVELPQSGYIEGRITDAEGGPIPCKVQFRGIEGTPSPDFGPDSGDHAVKNLYYTANGRFRQQIAPGTYDVIVSYGPEYDAVYKRITVARGEDTILATILVRSVDTTGWISTDFHSHSSPSGDNTSSQFGRVLNLLCEHLEFVPCTEHNRISSYRPHLERLGVSHLLATCPGMELTGLPGLINHQNAFPLVRKPRTQDGGGPRTDEDPIAQIERLALWDAGSDKLVQGNHPNIVQMLGDRDLDGNPDSGFAKMVGFMDVIEVHPPGEILMEPETGGRNRIYNWLQMLNLGYRVPGIVNTDAHYNFHGSGWLRNYIKCSTDDPARIKTMDIVHAAERGNFIMTNGPYLEVELSAGGKTVTAGDDLRVANGKAVLHVRVQCPNWFDVDRVQVFMSGRPKEELNFRRRESPGNFSPKTVCFDQNIPIHFEHDEHVIVVAVGEESQLGLVMGPDHEKDRPVAVSNPIYVDVDGNGFVPNKDLLDLDIPLLPAISGTGASQDSREIPPP